MVSKILKGYGHIAGINCGVCGENYMSIEATDDPEVIKLVCWCGASAKGPIDNPSIQAALGSCRIQDPTQGGGHP